MVRIGIYSMLELFLLCSAVSFDFSDTDRYENRKIRFER